MSDEDEVLELEPIEDGQAEGDEAEFEVSELDLENFSNHTVVVKIDGEDVRVPLKEALAGYQRQADYTRKTQGLAEKEKDLQWAAAIRGALDNDPQGTIELLADHYGISRAAAREMVDGVEPDAETDPQLAAYNARLARLEQREAEIELQGQITRLQSKYGEDFDPQEVVAEAFKTGSRDLEKTYKLIAFDRISEKQATAATKAAKRDAAAVSGGSTSRGGDDADPPIRSISDAWHAAKRAHSR